MLSQGQYYQSAFSPDGKWLAVATSIGIHLYDNQTMKEERLLETPYDSMSIVFSPDGKLLASGGLDGKVRLWELPSGTLRSGFSAHNAYINTIAFSPDGRILATAAFVDEEAKTWDTSTGKYIHTYPISNPYAVGFSSDGKILAVGKWGGGVCRWSLADHHELDQIVMAINAVFSPNGRWLASEYEKKITLWDPATGMELYSFASLDSQPAAFSADGNILALVGSKRVILWNVIKQSTERTFDIQADSVALSPDGKMLAAFDRTGVGTEHSLNIWSVENGFPKYALKEFDWDHIRQGLVFAPDGMILKAGFRDGMIRVWDFDQKILQTIPVPDLKQGIRMDFSPDGRKMAIIHERSVWLWDLLSNIRLSELDHAQTQSLAFSADGQILATGSNTVKLWEAQTGRELRTVTGFSATVNASAFSPDGKILATVSGYSEIQLWDVAAGNMLRTLSPSPCGVYDIAFLPVGNTLAAGGCGIVRSWNAETGKLKIDYRTRHQSVNSIVGSPDGQIISAGMFGVTILLDSTTSRELTRLTGYRGEVSEQVFSPDGKVLVTHAADGSIRVWGIPS